MNVEPPQSDQRDHDGRKPGRALRIAVAGAVAGVVAGLAIAFTYALGDISLKLTIMLALPAAILILGGLTVAMTSDPETAERQGFRAGMKAESLRRRWRSALGRQGKNGR